MAPLGDLVGITRQTSVFAFQLAEYINPVLPTSGVTMGILGLAGLRWEKWAKWMVPLLVLWFLFAAIDIAARPGIQFHHGLAGKFNAWRGNSARSEKTNSYPYADKWLMYDLSIRIPLVVYHPRPPAGRSGSFTTIKQGSKIPKRATASLPRRRNPRRKGD